MSDFITFIEYWGKILLMIVGAGTLVVGFIDGLFMITPKLKKAKVDFSVHLAKKYKNKHLIKNAIANEIEHHVNEVVSDLQNELPKGWIRKAAIQWVAETKAEELDEGEMILRICPLENQDHNFLTGVYSFFTKALFPRTKEVIPQNVRKAAILEISHRTICNKKQYLQKEFEDKFLETAIKEDNSIASYFGKYQKLDDSGFFTSTFLREIHDIASKTRFSELRNKIGEEIDQIIIHIEGFINHLNQQKGKISPGDWYRKGPATSYAFLLVARPEHRGVEPYLTRAKEWLDQDIERLYIMGAKEQILFVQQVISRVANIPGFEIVEIFDLNKDYRGASGGIGALFTKKELVAGEGDIIQNPE